jgi:hypothetical protein
MRYAHNILIGKFEGRIRIGNTKIDVRNEVCVCADVNQISHSWFQSRDTVEVVKNQWADCQLLRRYPVSERYVVRTDVL